MKRYMLLLVLSTFVGFLSTPSIATERGDDYENGHDGQNGHDGHDGHDGKPGIAKSNSTSLASSSSTSLSSSNGVGVGVGVGKGGYAVSTGFNGSRVSTGAVTVNQNQVRQTPFAYSPSNAIGYNPFKCTDSASLGVSSGFGAISGGMPINDDSCQFLVKVDYLFRNGFIEEGCELLATDEVIGPIFKKTNRVCQKINTPTPTPLPSISKSLDELNKKWDAIEAKRDSILRR